MTKPRALAAVLAVAACGCAGYAGDPWLGAAAAGLCIIIAAC